MTPNDYQNLDAALHDPLPLDRPEPDTVWSTVWSSIWDLRVANAKLQQEKDFLASKGLTVGMMKTSDKPEPYMVYVCEPDSEFDDTIHVNKVIDAEIKTRAAEQRLEQAREVLKECECSTVGKDGCYRCPSCYSLCTGPNLITHKPNCKLAAALSSTPPTGWVHVDGELMNSVKGLLQRITLWRKGVAEGVEVISMANEVEHLLTTTRTAARKEQA